MYNTHDNHRVNWQRYQCSYKKCILYEKKEKYLFFSSSLLLWFDASLFLFLSCPMNRQSFNSSARTCWKLIMCPGSLVGEESDPHATRLFTFTVLAVLAAESHVAPACKLALRYANARFCHASIPHIFGTPWNITNVQHIICMIFIRVSFLLFMVLNIVLISRDFRYHKVASSENISICTTCTKMNFIFKRINKWVILEYMSIFI